ncbi:GOLPH3/VPS74 family protein [Parvularcula lutaonensis]|uniref:GPP34 family phosphoprotein n=1 Tax=Parvularcula lutaonensis TaxID=491923 RepID=A0ABV7MD71_9PROT|nr:GPP34 family phosphoprotein [Parvularcula lutaonensis]GGY51910.1 hypothetical protein GCM10007148_21060 [Parvularcula lutaonensis]
MRDKLNLPEELLLLILDDDTGRERASLVSYLSAGAALAEFALEERVAVTGEDRKQRYELVDPSRPDHPYLAAVLDVMNDRGFSKSPQSLVSAVGGKGRLLEHLRSALVDKGILRRERKKALGLFSYTVYPLADRAAEEAVKARIKMTITSEGEVSPRDAVLITLVKHAGILHRTFGRDLIGERKRRIKEITQGEHLATSATHAAIAAVQAALIAATTASTVAATSG